MGFLKRLFSIGSKKNKSKRVPIIHNVPLPEPTIPPMNDEDHEAAVGRLLRSTSARLAENSELDYATLPPIPHPINRVIQTPASSCVSLASTSISQRGTYNVTVHRRRRHISTEVPLANGNLEDINPTEEKGTSLQAEDSRVLRLRSDPSVASLLELYDEHGRVANDAFCNDEPSPPKDGRAQVRRSGSTLRQLLGVPFSGDGNENSEGDISWAERFLAESDATSMISSSGLQTPESPQFQLATPEVSITSDADISINNPGISSMEVEVDDSYNDAYEYETSFRTNNPYSTPDPNTPQRASQIFGFLTKGKQSKSPIDFDRTLPDPPSCFSSPSDEGGPGSKRIGDDRKSLGRFSFNLKRFSAPPMSSDDDTRSENILHSAKVPQELYSAFSDDSHVVALTPQVSDFVSSNARDAKQNDIRVLMTGPTKVIVTAPTPGTSQPGPSRLRGPRGPSRKSSSGNVMRRRSVLGEVSSNRSSTMAGDPFVVVTAKQQPRTERRNSTSSNRSSLRREVEQREDYISHPKKTRPISPTHSKTNTLKENHLCLGVKNELPLTPLRSHSSRLLKTIAQAPNPNLSSELSSVGRQMMHDVRLQRMKARETERSRLGNRF